MSVWWHSSSKSIVRWWHSSTYVPSLLLSCTSSKLLSVFLLFSVLLKGSSSIQAASMAPRIFSCESYKLPNELSSKL